MTTHPIRFARLGYCRLRCPDLDKSVAFYRDMVGLMGLQARATHGGCGAATSPMT